MFKLIHMTFILKALKTPISFPESIKPKYPRPFQSEHQKVFSILILMHPSKIFSQIRDQRISKSLHELLEHVGGILVARINLCKLTGYVKFVAAQSNAFTSSNPLNSDSSQPDIIYHRDLI